MEALAAPTRVDEVLDRLDAVLADLAAVELEPADVTGALALTRRMERAGRRVAAEQVRVVTAIDDGGLHRTDGHASSPVMVAHAANLSPREAKKRGRASRALRDLPVVEAGHRAGTIGGCQVDLIARIHANPRTRDRFVELDAQVALLATRLPYQELQRRLENWVREADVDGTADRSRRNHDNRDFRIVDEYDLSWTALGSFGSLDGAKLHAILRAFTEAEFAADWAAARALHGDQTTVAHLTRTDAQRRADAVVRIFATAVDFEAATTDGIRADLDVVVDQHTLEQHLRRNAGTTTEPPAPDLGPIPDPPAPWPGDPAPAPTAPAPAPELLVPAAAPRTRCETLDGKALDPSEVAAHALIARMRRVVYGARSVVTDLSELNTLFTGSAKLAVQLERTTCYWPGCHLPVTWCQADHLTPRRDNGRTNPGNGAPCCGRHNRHKEHGYTVHRDQRGRITVNRPDGTPLEDWS